MIGSLLGQVCLLLVNNCHFRYQGKTKALMYDVTKIIAALKAKRGDHRVFRLAENLCMNVIFSLRDFFPVKREGKVSKNGTKWGSFTSQFSIQSLFFLCLKLMV